MIRTRLLLFVTLTLMGLECLSQHYFTSVETVALSSEYGSVRPRLVVHDDGVGCLWSKPGGELYYANRGLNGFETPIRLSEEGHDMYVAGYGGSDIAAKGSDIYSVYMTLPYLSARVFIRHSSDGGESWGEVHEILMPDSIIPFLPTVDVDENGQPTVLVMGYDSTYADPQYYITRSIDNGASFGTLANLSKNAPREVCDCCPAHLIVASGEAHAYYRNNNNNLRDMWYAKSSSASVAADTTFDIDPSDWFINGCPSQGPDAVAGEDYNSAVWMTSVNGESQIMYNQLNTTTLSSQTTYLTNSTLAKFLPRIAGDGDTVAVVFEQVDSPVLSCVVMYSLDGGETFEGPIDIAQDSSGIFRAPDIEFSSGGFDLVYRDIFEERISYRRLEFGSPAGISSMGYETRIYPNPTTDHVMIDSDGSLVSATLRNIAGTRLMQARVDGKQSMTLQLDGQPSGVYLLEIELSDGSRMTRRLVVQP